MKLEMRRLVRVFPGFLVRQTVLARVPTHYAITAGNGSVITLFRRWKSRGRMTSMIAKEQLQKLFEAALKSLPPEQCGISRNRAYMVRPVSAYANERANSSVGFAEQVRVRIPASMRTAGV